MKGSVPDKKEMGSLLRHVTVNEEISLRCRQQRIQKEMVGVGALLKVDFVQMRKLAYQNAIFFALGEFISANKEISLSKCHIICPWRNY